MINPAKKLKIIVISAALLILGIWLIGYGLTAKSAISLPAPTEAAMPTSIVPTSTESSSSAVLGEQISGEEVWVKRVVDGDTIELSDGRKLRYIGIDTPETLDPRRPVGCFGKEASLENKKLVEGKKIILEKDISQTDKFGRLLRYVYLPQENGSLIFINDYLVRNGFAKASTYPPDIKFSETFKEAEREARDNKLGLWGSCP